MKRLTEAQLAHLPVGTRVARIKDGNIEFYLLAGPHPRAATIQSLRHAVVLVKDSNLMASTVVHSRNFEQGEREQWFVEYDTAVAGEIMKAQLQYLIEGVEAVYFPTPPKSSPS